MGKREILYDDLDESQPAETIYFSLNGTDYQIDLSADNKQKLYDALSVYVGHARSVGSSSRRGAGRRGGGGGRSSEGSSVSANDIRAWAKAEGKEVSERGRVPAKLRQEYEAAHS